VAAPLSWWASVLHALWLFLPAYVANMAPVVAAKVLPRWNAPIDGGRVAKDGRRVLGAGKTWRGLVAGAVLGGAVAVGLAFWAPQWGVMRGWDDGASGAMPGCDADPACAPTAFGALRAGVFGALLGAAALVGDAVKSYFKRRLGKEGGAPWVPFDQLDFVVAGLAALVAFSWLLPAGWVWSALSDPLVWVTLLLLTPLLHFVVNVLGYALKLKSVPW